MARHDHPAGCTADAHIHTIEHAALPGVMLGLVIMFEHRPIASVFDETLADRLCTLLNRHGLADAPVYTSGAWPPPAPTERIRT